MVALSANSGGQRLAAAHEVQDGTEASFRAAILEEIPHTAVDAQLVVRVGDPYTRLVRWPMRPEPTRSSSAPRPGSGIASPVRSRCDWSAPASGPSPVVP
jgi:hypothetical protein